MQAAIATIFTIITKSFFLYFIYFQTNKTTVSELKENLIKFTLYVYFFIFVKATFVVCFLRKIQ